MTYAALFLLAAGLDVLWALYIRATAAGSTLGAATLAAGIVLASGVCTILFVADRWYLIPTAAGAFAGTYLCQAWRKRVDH